MKGQLSLSLSLGLSGTHFVAYLDDDGGCCRCGGQQDGLFWPAKWTGALTFELQLRAAQKSIICVAPAEPLAKEETELEVGRERKSVRFNQARNQILIQLHNKLSWHSNFHMLRVANFGPALGRFLIRPKLDASGPVTKWVVYLARRHCERMNERTNERRA